jgi:hypothetical protein
VTAGSIPVTAVNLTVSDLTGPDGRKIPQRNFTLYREFYIQVTSPSPDPGSGNRPLGEGWYPDALIPLTAPANEQRRAAGLEGAPFDVEAETNQPVWVDLHVPQDAAPGSYSGAVSVVSGQRRIEIPIVLRVRNFEVPLKPTLLSSFGMHEPSLTDRRMHELLLEHRVMPESVNPEDARELIDKYGLNTTGLRFWSHFEKKDCSMNAAPSPATIAAALQRYPRDLPVHLYAADEIDSCPQVFDTVRRWAATMHAVDPRIDSLVTVAPRSPLYSDGTATGRPAVDIWALLPKFWDSDPGGLEEARAKRGQLWGYTALVQEAYSPKWEIDFAPVNYRILPGFLAQSMGLTGILYWRVELWTESPFKDLRGYTISGHFYPGEGMLVYPGGPVGLDTAIPSMRLKWIREGVQDFEYVAILKRLGRGDWALAQARRAGSSWREWTRDPDVLDSVRDQLGDEIERVTGSNAPPVNGARPGSGRKGPA